LRGRIPLRREADTFTQTDTYAQVQRDPSCAGPEGLPYLKNDVQVGGAVYPPH